MLEFKPLTFGSVGVHTSNSATPPPLSCDILDWHYHYTLHDIAMKSFLFLNFYGKKVKLYPKSTFTAAEQ
jgi:hypothetical protein